MPWVFVIGVKAPDGSLEQREFEVKDARLAQMLKRIIFDKTATHEEMMAFAAEIAKDPELAREWNEVRKHIEVPRSLQ